MILPGRQYGTWAEFDRAAGERLARPDGGTWGVVPTRADRDRAAVRATAEALALGVIRLGQVAEAAAWVMGASPEAVAEVGELVRDLAAAEVEAEIQARAHAARRRAADRARRAGTGQGEAPTTT